MHFGGCYYKQPHITLHGLLSVKCTFYYLVNNDGDVSVTNYIG